MHSKNEFQLSSNVTAAFELLCNGIKRIAWKQYSRVFWTERKIVYTILRYSYILIDLNKFFSFNPIYILEILAYCAKEKPKNKIKTHQTST